MTQGQKDSKVARFSLRFFSGVLFLMMGILSTFQVPGATAAEVVDRIVAVVNDEIIVLQDVKGLLTSLQQQIETAGLSEQEKQNILSEKRESLIKELVNRKLIVQAAREYEWITVTDAEIDASVERIKEQNGFTDEQLAQALEKEGLTLEQLRVQLRESSLSNKLENYEVRSKIVITKEDVTQYYNEHADQYGGKTTYHLRNIFIKTPASESTADKEATTAKLDKIIAEFEAGTSFEELARKYSDSAYANEGGELGNFELSDLSENLRAAIEPLSPGEITRPLETSDGYQILFVQEIHKESNTPLESVYSDIETELFKERYQERWQAWIEGLRENAHIKIIQ